MTSEELDAYGDEILRQPGSDARDEALDALADEYDRRAAEKRDLARALHERLHRARRDEFNKRVARQRRAT
jgi:hypothetical protein